MLRLAPAVLDGQRAEFLASFAREARIVASLNHPALVRTLDFGTLDHAQGPTPWMALEWIDGPTLEQELAAHPGARRGPREALTFLRPAFDALACAHEAGIAHRDVKPANLVVPRARPGDPGLRVQGFTVAKPMEGEDGASDGETATASEVTAWSPLYAAPEQLSRTRTGPWTDVHALALLLVELLVGAPAYGATGGPALFSAVLDRTRPTPGRHRVEVGPWEAVLDRALALRPADRPRDAASLLAALEETVDAAQSAWTSGAADRGFADTVLSIASPPPRASQTPSSTSQPLVVGRTTRARPALWLSLGVALGALLAFGAWMALRRSPDAAPPDAPVPTPIVTAPAAPTVTPTAPVVVPTAPTAPVVMPTAPIAPAAPVVRAPAPRVTLPTPAPRTRAPAATPPHRIVIE